MSITEDPDMITKHEIVNGIVDLLNEALKADPETIHKLIDNRVKCNPTLANHEDIQVNMFSEVGILGIINGICWRVAGEKICIIVDDNSGKVISFTRYESGIHELKK